MVRQAFMTEMRYSELASKLATLAQWQESVLTNPLVMHARKHTVGAGTALQTAQYLERKEPSRRLVQAQSVAPVRTGPGARPTAPVSAVPARLRPSGSWASSPRMPVTAVAATKASKSPVSTGLFSLWPFS